MPWAYTACGSRRGKAVLNCLVLKIILHYILYKLTARSLLSPGAANHDLGPASCCACGDHTIYSCSPVLPCL